MPRHAGKLARLSYPLYLDEHSRPERVARYEEKAKHARRLSQKANAKVKRKTKLGYVEK